jgi:hypothetical protein
MPPRSTARKARILAEGPRAVSEILSESTEQRGHRAMALMCATVCWKGDPTDTEGLLSVADEFLQYIQGDDSVMPRPDKLIKGKIPRR